MLRKLLKMTKLKPEMHLRISGGAIVPLLTAPLSTLADRVTFFDPIFLTYMIGSLIPEELLK